MGRIWIPGKDPDFKVPPRFALEVKPDPKRNLALVNIHAFHPISKKHLGSIDFSFGQADLEGLVAKFQAILEEMKNQDDEKKDGTYK